MCPVICSKEIKEPVNMTVFSLGTELVALKMIFGFRLSNTIHIRSLPTTERTTTILIIIHSNDDLAW